MSAPQTNLETQKRRHRGPLIGSALVVIFGVGLIAYWILEESAVAENPVGSPAEEAGQGPTIEGVETGTAPVTDPPAGGAQPDTGAAPRPVQPAPAD